MGVRSKHGKLYLDFYWQGVRCREFTGLDDTPENRRRCVAFLNVIQGEVALGTFDYRRHFPNGTRLREFYPEVEAGSTTVEEYLRVWHERRSPFRPDGTVVQGSDLHPSTWKHDGSILNRRIIRTLGSLRLKDLTSGHCRDFRRSLQDTGLSGKSVTNIQGLLHKAMDDAVEEGLIPANPVPKLSRGARTAQRLRMNSDPLMLEQVQRFLEVVPPAFRDLYVVWFRTGWRPSEILALRFDWLDFDRQTVMLRLGRIPRWGGVEAPPKTGPREVDCSYDAEIFAAFERRRRASLSTGQRDYVFTDATGQPLSQDWLHKRVWLATLRKCGFRSRGQYNIRDSFVSLSLSAGEDPGWVAQVCGTSEQMIFRHYRRWMSGLVGGAGQRISSLYGGKSGPQIPDFGHRDGHRDQGASLNIVILKKNWSGRGRNQFEPLASYHSISQFFKRDRCLRTSK